MTAKRALTLFILFLHAVFEELTDDFGEVYVVGSLCYNQSLTRQSARRGGSGIAFFGEAPEVFGDRPR